MHVQIETYPRRLQKTSTNSSLENNQRGPARADLQSRMYYRNKLEQTQRGYDITPHVTVAAGEQNKYICFCHIVAKVVK